MPSGTPSGGAGAGNRAEEHAGHDGGQADATEHVTHDFVSEGQQAPGKAARAHEDTRRDEEGNGHDREAVDGREGHLSHVFDGKGVRADDGRQRGQAEADGHRHADGAEDHEIAEERGQRFDVLTEKDRGNNDEDPDKTDKRIHKAADLHLLIEGLQQAQAHEAEAERQNQIGDEEGDTQGRRVLGVLHEAFDLPPAEIGNGGRKDEEEHFHHDPADLLPARRQMIIKHVHADGRTLLDSYGKGEIGNPDEDVAGKLFGPYRRAGALDELRNDVAVDDLPGDEKRDGQQADDQKDLFEILVEPVQHALPRSGSVFHAKFL